MFEGSSGQVHGSPGKVRLSRFTRRPTQVFLFTNPVLIFLYKQLVNSSIFLINMKIAPYFRSHSSSIPTKGAICHSRETFEYMTQTAPEVPYSLRSPRKSQKAQAGRILADYDLKFEKKVKVAPGVDMLNSPNSHFAAPLTVDQQTASAGRNYVTVRLSHHLTDTACAFLVMSGQPSSISICSAWNPPDKTRRMSL